MSLKDILYAPSRNYITPETVQDALDHAHTELREHRREAIAEVRQLVLEALGKRRAEDWSLCAFVAARGTKSVP